MLKIESKYYPFPQSVREPREGAFVGVETLPLSCIEEIVNNPEARNFLPKSLAYLASQDWLASNIRMSVPVNQGSYSILAPICWGRAIPIGCGILPFGKETPMVGRIVSGKGSWFSGFLTKNLDWAGTPGNTFYGLLSQDGASGDVIVSNALLSSGFRSALHFGYAILKTKQLQEWTYKQWLGTDVSKYIEEMFSRLNDSNSGLPAYLFRISGSMERFDYLYPNWEAPVREAHEFSIANRLMLLEAHESNSFISRTLAALPDSDLTYQAIDALAKRQPLTSQQLRAYILFNAAILARNARAISRAIKLIPSCKIDGAEIGQAKDLDIALFSCDYDVAIEGRSSEDPAFIYLKDQTYILSTLVNFILTHGEFISKDPFETAFPEISAGNMGTLELYFKLLENSFGEQN